MEVNKGHRVSTVPAMCLTCSENINFPCKGCMQILIHDLNQGKEITNAVRISFGLSAISG